MWENLFLNKTIKSKMANHTQQTLIICIICNFFLLLLACNSSTENVQAQAKESNNNQLNIDSIQRVFKQVLGTKKDPLPPNQIQESGKLYPVDEGQKLPQFYLFREEIFNAIKEKDAFTLLEMVHQNIRTSVDGSESVASFVDFWGLDNPQNIAESPLWKELEITLSMGGTFTNDGTSFYAPYVYSTFPDNLDGATHGAVTGSGVRLRQGPSLDSEVLQIITYEVVEVLELQASSPEKIGEDTYPWVKIKTTQGKEGFIFGKYFRSPLDYRACFQRMANGQWQMVYFLAGD